MNKKLLRLARNDNGCLSIEGIGLKPNAIRCTGAFVIANEVKQPPLLPVNFNLIFANYKY